MQPKYDHNMANLFRLFQMRPYYDHMLRTHFSLKYNHNTIITLWTYSFKSKCDHTIIIWRTYFSLAKIPPKDDHEIVNLF